mmetsp:Transcript_54482/g.125007  ORF Transcript_54482/g.125007 Transcript_54482/m.125007 type:complete len:216 (-) Transcript_54482:840-1487(-)
MILLQLHPLRQPPVIPRHGDIGHEPTEHSHRAPHRAHRPDIRAHHRGSNRPRLLLLLLHQPALALRPPLDLVVALLPVLRPGLRRGARVLPVLLLPPVPVQEPKKRGVPLGGQLREGPDLGDPAFFDIDDLVKPLQEVQLVQSHHHSAALAGHQPLENLPEDGVAHPPVHRRQGVIRQHHLGPSIQRPGNSQALLLPPGQRDAPLPDLRAVPSYH